MKASKFRYLITLFLFALLPAVAQAAETASDVMGSVHVIWILFCTALVFFMQPGFALLESGMARAKNSINVIMKNYADLCVGILGFWAVGYGLMFGASYAGLIGTDGFFFNAPDTASLANLLYQMMFAATAATIVSGAVAERMRFIPYVIGALFIIILIYPVFGSWVWGGSETQPGWLRGMGFIDAAGSTAVHSIGAWCALAAVIVLGPRLGRFSSKGDIRDIPGHNLPSFSLGAFILWFGWFGFNGGAAESDFSDLGLILVNTMLAAGAGLLGAFATMNLLRRPVLMTMSINGALGGLVAITAGCKTMDPAYAVLTGALGGFVVVIGQGFFERARIDDMVGAIPVHGLGGAWGTIAAGLFYRESMFNIDLVLTQIIGIITAFLWAFCMSWLLFKIIDLVVGIRASTVHEQRGLDFTEHCEVAYNDFMAVRTFGEVNPAKNGMSHDGNQPDKRAA